MKSGIIALSLIALSWSTQPGAAQQAGYFQRQVDLTIGDTGTGETTVMLSGLAPTYGSVRTISIWCELPLPGGPTGAFATLTTPGAGGQAQLIIPLPLQVADDKAASPFRYFAGTLNPFFEVMPGQQSRIAVTTDGRYPSGADPGICHASFFGVLTQP